MNSNLNEELKKMLVNAVFLTGMKKWSTAINEFDNILELNPDYGEAYIGKGIALIELGRILEAKMCFEEALQLGHQNAISLLAECRKRLGETGSEEWFRSANTLLSTRLFNEALILSENRLKNFPNEEMVWYVKGNAYFGLGRNSDATIAFKRVIELNPGFPGAWNNLGWILVLENKFIEALEYFEKAIMLNSNFTDAWMNKGAVLLHLGRFKDALSSLERAKQLGHPNAIPAIEFCKSNMV